tara:strand:- start:929 stop:1771 length:843 start_codon:yes stop_codon:yes gene_type:complete
MFKKTIFASAMILATSTAALASDLYIINGGSKGGTSNAQMTAWMTDLKPYFDVKYVQAKGCAKTAAILRKLKNIPNAQSITMSSSTRDYSNKDCQLLYGNKDNYLYSIRKAGLIFKKKGSTADFNKSGATIGINSDNDKFIAALSKVTGIEYKMVRYENSKGVTLGVLNGEVDFGIVNSAKRFWRNETKLTALYNLSDEDNSGVPSLSKSIKGAPVKNLFSNFIYFGANKAEVLAKMQKAFNNGNSASKKWISSAKGYVHNINSPNNGWLEMFIDQYPMK